MPVRTYRCPDNDRGPQEDGKGRPDIVGCGHVFEAEPDDEGFVDCHNCGIWFDPKIEPYTATTMQAVSDE